MLLQEVLLTCQQFVLVHLCALSQSSIRQKTSTMMKLDRYMLGPWCELWTFYNLDTAPIIFKDTTMELRRRIMNAKDIVYLLHKVHKNG